MRTSLRTIALGFASLSFATSVLAMPMPENVAGPPLYSIHGCPSDETLTPEVV